MSRLKYGLFLLVVTTNAWSLPLPSSVESPGTFEVERRVGAENHPHVHQNSTFYRDGTYVLEYRDEYGKEIAEVYPPRGLPYSIEVDDPRWVSTYDSDNGSLRRGSATWELLRW